MPYIDRDKLISEIASISGNLNTRNVGEAISRVPTADVVERKRGKWKVAMLDHESMGCRPKAHYCSVCNHITTFRTFFCPNCGAEMERSDNGRFD